MQTNKKTVAVITARGGSKGLPGKNIKPLGGIPLIGRTIQCAKASGMLDRIIVTTDDPEIARVAKEYGAEVPFPRPAELAQDTTAHLPVMQHALTWLKENGGYEPDYTMILQPTSPFRTPEQIAGAVHLIETTGADSVLSVLPVEEKYNPHKVMVLTSDGSMKLMNGDPVYKRIARRQDLPKAYTSASLIYLFKTSLLFDPINPNFYGEKTVPYVIDDPRRAVDINTPDDWTAAEKMLVVLEKQS